MSLTVPWERHLLVLYVASALIMVRSVFRIAEYVMGWDGFLLNHEVFLYIFDAVLMFITMVLFNFWHPSEIIGRDVLAAVGTLGSTDSGHELEGQVRRGYLKS